jgi:hypothetical protein
MPEVVDVERIKVDIPFEGDESSRYRKYIKNTGRAQGPWIRTLILRAMDAETPRGVGALLPDHPEAS